MNAHCVCLVGVKYSVRCNNEGLKWGGGEGGKRRTRRRGGGEVSKLNILWNPWQSRGWQWGGSVQVSITNF